MCLDFSQEEKKEDFKALRARFHAQMELNDSGGPKQALQPPIAARQGPSFGSSSPGNGAFRGSPRGPAVTLNMGPPPPGPKMQGTPRNFKNPPRFPRQEAIDSSSPSNDKPPLGILIPKPLTPIRSASSDDKAPGDLPEAESSVKQRANDLRQNLMLRQQLNKGSQEGIREAPKAVVLTPPPRSQKSVTESPAPLRKPLPLEKNLGPRPFKPKRPPLVCLDNFKKKKIPPIPERPTPGKINDDQDTYDDVESTAPLQPPPPLPPKISSEDLKLSGLLHGCFDAYLVCISDSLAEQGDEESDGSDLYEEVDSIEVVHKRHDKSRQMELKRQQEMERKEQKDKEKREMELRKKFKLSGPIEVLYTAKMRLDNRGGKYDLTVKAGDTVEIVRVKSNPEGKWLARTLDGTYGYIDNKSVNIDYEEVRRNIRSQAQQLENSPGWHKKDEFYDDVGSSDQMNSSRNTDNDEVYDDVDIISEEFPPPPPELSLEPKKSKKEEKEEKEFRKKFKFDGPIEVLCRMMVDPNANIKKASGKDLSLSRGEILSVILFVNEKKAICRNEKGKCEWEMGTGDGKCFDFRVYVQNGSILHPQVRTFDKWRHVTTTPCPVHRYAGVEKQNQAKVYFSFPGELLMRMLKMLILPLITSSLMSGLSAMDSRACGRMGVITITYYLWTTFIAVIVGIILVLIIHPGAGAVKEGDRANNGPVMTSADALLDLIRNMFPSNLIEATFQQYRTQLIPSIKPLSSSRIAGIAPNFVYIVPDEKNPKLGTAVYLELTPAPEVIYKSTPGNSREMNVLGIVLFSATIGLLLGKMGERGMPMVNVCQCINECVMKIISAAVWKDLRDAGPDDDWEKAGPVCGHSGVWSPYPRPDSFAHLLLSHNQEESYPICAWPPTGFGDCPGNLIQASSIKTKSSATLPITMKCLLENNRVDRRIARFVLPVGATINMDGTALYEAVAAIFIAQVNQYDLDFGQIITISITATAASIGAAGIPQAGLVTMVIVLTSVGLPADDITLIVAVDWALDRFRTMINVLGDALAAGIIAHICRKDFMPSMEKDDLICSVQNLPTTEIPLLASKDCVFEVIGDTVTEKPTVYYNICQV
ncbi:EAA5 protein, partial [Polypterus senegalus]|nr:EAA5 protein [Polypterus senegalus]